MITENEFKKETNKALSKFIEKILKTEHMEEEIKNHIKNAYIELAKVYSIFTFLNISILKIRCYKKTNKLLKKLYKETLNITNELEKLLIPIVKSK